MTRPITNLTAIVSSLLQLSYMGRNPDSILKLSLGLKPIIFPPYRRVYGLRPNFRFKDCPEAELRLAVVQSCVRIRFWVTGLSWYLHF